MLTPLLTVLFALPQDPPQATAVVLPLQQLCTRDRDAANPPWGSLLRFTPTPERRMNLVLDAGEASRVTADRVVEALYELESDAMDEGHLFVQPVGDNLLAYGAPADVARVRALVAEATQALARPLRVELALWDAADRTAPATVLGPKQFAEFRAAHEPIWRSTGTSRGGQPVALQNMRWTSYVRSLDVEVAQKQTMSRPETDRCGEGAEALVRAWPLIGGDEFAVHAQFAAAVARGLPRVLQTGMPGAADLELPRLESFFGACSGRIPNGGALAATLRGSAATGGQVVLTVQVSSPTPPGALARKDMALFPIGALTNASLTQRFELPDRGTNQPNPLTQDEVGVFGHIAPDQLHELVHGVLEAADSEDAGSARFAGDHLFVRGSPAAVAAVEALLRSLQEQLVQNLEVRHTAELRAAPNDAAATQPILHDLALPSLLGREAIACRLFETNVVADVHIEIAQEASTLAPQVEALQVGAWLRARGAPVGERLHVDLEVFASSAPVPSTRLVMPGGGALMPTDVSEVRLAHDGLVDAQQAIEHGDGPTVQLDGRTFRSTMKTTLRR